MRRTDQIKEIKDLQIANYEDAKVLIDSTELNGTFLMSFNEVLKALGRVIPVIPVIPPPVMGDFGLAFSTGNAVQFDNGNVARV